jgi:uncharacterized protein
MRRLLAATIAASTLTLAVSFSAPVLAAGADPSVDQIYQAVQAGHIDQAQTMIEEVLRDNPGSWKAHFIQAELFAKEGKTAQARAELNRAEEIQPGLPRENPHSVDELKSQLGLTPRSSSAPHFNGMTSGPAPQSHFPVWTVVVLVGAVILLVMLFRRRSPAAYPMGAIPAGGGAPGYGGPGYGGPGYGGPVGGGGIGSGIAGGLASGLAVGAGVVAGEELAHHFLDGGQREGSAPPAADNSGWQGSNNDMGGSDFGVNDPGSWDDGSGGGGDSGGDWS